MQRRLIYLYRDAVGDVYGPTQAAIHVPIPAWVGRKLQRIERWIVNTFGPGW